MPSEQLVSLRTFDGLQLAGTLASPDEPADKAVVFVHGGGVTREEGGFFTRLAAGVSSSGSAVALFRAPHRLVEIEGAQHGIAVHDDPQYLNPQTQEWQAFAIQTVADWVVGEPSV